MKNKTGIILTLVFFILSTAHLSNKDLPIFKQVDYKIHNIVDNRTDKPYYTDIVNLGLNELNIKNSYIRIVNSDSTEFIGDNWELKAKVNGKGYFYVITIYNLSKKESIEVLSHELIHVKQLYSGVLRVHNDYVYFRGRIWRLHNIPPYSYRPWENEAYKISVFLENHITNLLVD
jgi:predicted metallopeptidase